MLKMLDFVIDSKLRAERRKGGYNEKGGVERTSGRRGWEAAKRLVIRDDAMRDERRRRL